MLQDPITPWASCCCAGEQGEVGISNKAQQTCTARANREGQRNKKGTGSGRGLAGVLGSDSATDDTGGLTGLTGRLTGR